MSGKFSMDDYVDVAERIQSFYARFPEGRLTCGEDPQLLEAGGKTFIIYHAKAYRDPEDTLPGDGWAWEPVPGPTQFTKDSELQNAETAAWGRAIVALGFETKKIASKQEVQARVDSTPVKSAGVLPDTKSGNTNVILRPKEPLAGYHAHEKIEQLIDQLKAKDSKRDWLAAAEKASNRDFGHGIKELTVSEAELLAGKLDGFLKERAAA